MESDLLLILIGRNLTGTVRNDAFAHCEQTVRPTYKPTRRVFSSLS